MSHSYHDKQRSMCVTNFLEITYTCPINGAYWPVTNCQSVPKSGSSKFSLTHWGPVTHICVGDLTIIGSDNGLSPGRHQAIIWTSVIICINEYYSLNP